VPVGDENTDGLYLGKIADVENDEAANYAHDGHVGVPQVVVPVQSLHGGARFGKKLRLVQVAEGVLSDLPGADFSAVEPCHYFVGGQLQHAVYLAKVRSEANQVSLDERRILPIDLRAADFAVLAAL